MSGFQRHDLPADITVFAGSFASQPLVFAHLLDEAPDLDFGQIEVVQGAQPLPRLENRFGTQTAQKLLRAAAPYDTLVLILPAAFDSLICPFSGSTHLMPLGVHRGTVPRLIATGDGGR